MINSTFAAKNPGCPQLKHALGGAFIRFIGAAALYLKMCLQVMQLIDVLGCEVVHLVALSNVTASICQVRIVEVVTSVHILDRSVAFGLSPFCVPETGVK